VLNLPLFEKHITYTTNNAEANKEYSVEDVTEYLSALYKNKEKVGVSDGSGLVYKFDLVFALDVVGSYMQTVCEYMPKGFIFKLNKDKSISIHCVWQDADEMCFMYRDVGGRLRRMVKEG
jgi:hypothetical protein